MGNIHFSIQDLIEIMCFALSLVYLLQIFLVGLIPPTSSRYFAVHFGLLVVMLLGFITKHLSGNSLFFSFLPLLMLIALASIFFLRYYLQHLFLKIDIKRSSVKAIWLGELGLVLFLSAWLSSFCVSKEVSQGIKSIDVFLAIGLFVMLPVQSMYYSYNAVRPFRSPNNRGNRSPERYEKLVMNWIRILIFGYLGLTIAVLISIAVERLVFRGLPYLLIIVYLASITIYVCFNKKKMTMNNTRPKTRKNSLNETRIRTYNELKIQLVQLMENEKLYLNKSLTIQDVADKLNTNSKYLSEAINTQLGQGFVAFINGYRVEHVKNLLKDPKNNHFTLETIGKMAGFNSKSSFNAIFKKFEKVTPSTYKSRQQSKPVQQEREAEEDVKE